MCATQTSQAELTRLRADAEARAEAAMTGRSVTAQLAGLAAMREAGIGMVERLSLYVDAKLPEAEAKLFQDDNGVIRAFARLTRSVRQIMAMEQELLGLREIPTDSWSQDDNLNRARRQAALGSWDNTDLNDPSDLTETSDLRDRNDLNDLAEPDDLDDLDRGPRDRVVAEVHQTLSAYEDLPTLEEMCFSGNPNAVLARRAGRAPYGLPAGASGGGRGRHRKQGVASHGRDPP